MKLPEPYIYYADGDTYTVDAVREIFANDSGMEKLYTEAQLREALASHEAVMRQSLELLGPQAPECCGCRAEWDMAIKALDDALK